MTDLERFVELYKSVGINCVVRNQNDTLTEQASPSDDYPISGNMNCITLGRTNDYSPLLGSVGSAFTNIWFDEEGKFFSQSFIAG